jgi:hypothetical protein
MYELCGNWNNYADDQRLAKQLRLRLLTKFHASDMTVR